MSVWEYACCIAPRLDTKKSDAPDEFDVFSDEKLRASGIKGF